MKQEPKLPDGDDASQFDTGLGSRISAVLDLYETRSKAAEIAGISTDQLAKYVKGEAQPRWDTLVRLAYARDVSLDWLATGRGEMRLGLAAPAAVVRPLGTDLQMPVFDAALSLGHGAHNHADQVVGHVALPIAYLRDHLHVQPAEAVGVYMRGDSMEPTLRDGDIAILDRSVHELGRDDVYAFQLADEGYIKRLQRAGSRIIVRSDNQAYGPWEIGPDDRFTILGRVVGSIRRS